MLVRQIVLQAEGIVRLMGRLFGRFGCVFVSQLTRLDRSFRWRDRKNQFFQKERPQRHRLQIVRHHRLVRFPQLDDLKVFALHPLDIVVPQTCSVFRLV